MKWVVYLSSEKADMLPFDVLAESHLKQRKSHVKRLHDVSLTRQRMISVESIFIFSIGSCT